MIVIIILAFARFKNFVSNQIVNYSNINVYDSLTIDFSRLVIIWINVDQRVSSYFFDRFKFSKEGEEVDDVCTGKKLPAL